MKPADEKPTKVCPVCGTPIRRDRFMCLAHWRQLPTRQQVAIWRTWRAFQNRRTPESGLQSLREYREATDAATSYVQSLQTTTIGRSPP